VENVVVNEVSYLDIKRSLLACYWRGCRDQALSGWSDEQVCAWAYGEFEDAYDLAVEVLMLEVASLILSGEWSTKLADYHVGEISRILGGTGCEEFLAGVSADDRDDFIKGLQIINAHLPGAGWSISE